MMMRIREITDEMRHLREQKNEVLRMKLRGEVDAKTFREVTAEIRFAYPDRTLERLMVLPLCRSQASIHRIDAGQLYLI
jgi:hypothetical protein